MLISFDMKTLKVYEDVHTAVKVDAAQQGRTTTCAASMALRKFYGLPDASEPEDESEESSTPETEAAK
jgi:hypothetical protein